MPVVAYSLVCLLFGLLYIGILALYVRGWRRLPTWEIPPDFVPATSVTVLVPARNEAANIGACLRSILACNYPQELLEILVLDDFSEDDTARIVSEIAATCAGKVQLIRLNEQPLPQISGKKKALELGVARAHGVLIATTDADCLVPADWLLLLVSLFETKRPGAIVAPVLLHPAHTVFQKFQALDLAGMMGITGAGLGMGWHRMGNGANLCYAKKTFEAVGGYAGNMDRASGDDLFLLGKIAAAALPMGEGLGFNRASLYRRDPAVQMCITPSLLGGVCFLKNPASTVCTLPSPDLRSFVQQRLRWGTKNAALPDPGLKTVLAVVFLFCCTLVANVFLLFFLHSLIWVCLLQLLLKALADYMLLREMCMFFGRRELLRSFWPAFFLHTAYVTGIGLGSLFVKKYHWKGRRLR